MNEHAPTLVVLAAGMGSRYGGLKQFDAMGPHGETLLDYSVHDALRAGFVARVAGRVGLPSHAGPDEVVETLARASGRQPDAIADVLYGPPPTDDESLSALTHALDTLESEVQRA